MKVLRPVEPRYGDRRVTKDGRLLEYGPALGGMDWVEVLGLPAEEIEAIRQKDERHRTEMGEMSLPTPFVWRDPEHLPPRPWLYGHHLLRRQVSVTVAPGGVGKSSLEIVEGLAMVSGRDLLGDRPTGKLRVWLFNLEDPRDELERRVIAAMLHHNVRPEEIDGRLFLDTGRELPLCTAIQTHEGAQILHPAMDRLEEQLRARRIDVLVVDPFVSSHQVNENDNGAVDRVAKEWAALADRCNCAVELVHHTRKLNGEEGTTESGRGASALLGAARSGRVLNRMSEADRVKANLPSDQATYFSVTRDKANLAPASGRVWRRMASVHLANGDSVGVAEAWEWPDTMEGVSAEDARRVQLVIAAREVPPRLHPQAADWVGRLVAETIPEQLDLTDKGHKARIGAMVNAWIRSGVLAVQAIHDGRTGRDVEHVVAGPNNPATVETFK